MRNLFIRYFSILVLLFIGGVSAYGSTRGENIADQSFIALSSADGASLTVADQHLHGAIERRVLFSQSEVSSSLPRYLSTQSLHKAIPVAYRESGYQPDRPLYNDRYQSLLGIRYIKHFYIYTLRKIII